MAVTTQARIDDEVVEPARVDARPRWRRLVAPLATAAAVGVGCVLVALVDPNEPGHYPVCPTRWLFGVDCPACGMLRGTHDLLHGNLAGAADHNILIFALYPLVIVLWARWLIQSWRGEHPAVTRRQARLRDRGLMIVMLAIVAFGVIRWFVPYLGSGLSGG